MSNKILRILLLLVLAPACFVGAHAVLPETTIDKTVIMLANELQELSKGIDLESNFINDRRNEYLSQLDNIDENISIAEIVLLSKEDRYLFSIAQASNMMLEQTHSFSHIAKPTDAWYNRLDEASRRYELLHRSLQRIDSAQLSAAGLQARKRAMLICDTLRASVTAYKELADKDHKRYNLLKNRVDSLEKYNSNVISNVKNKFLFDRGETYGSILRNIESRGYQALYELDVLVNDPQLSSKEWETEMETTKSWTRYNNIIGIILGILSYFVYFRRRPRNSFMWQMRRYLAILVGLVSMIIGDVLYFLFVEASRYMLVIHNLETELCLFMTLLLIAALMRCPHKSMLAATRVNLPFFVLLYTVIFMRTNLFPVSTVTFLLPLFYTFGLIWIIIAILRCRKKLPKPELATAFGNFAVITAATIMSYAGYTFQSVVLVLFFMTVVTGITVLYICNGLLKRFQIKQKSEFMHITVVKLLYPLAVIFLIFESIFWVGHIFSLETWLASEMQEPFIDIDDFGVISVFKITAIIWWGIFVNYALSLIQMIAMRSDPERFGTGNMAVALSVFKILVWLGYAIYAMFLLDINRHGIVVAIGGASVGIGFAMKDTFENMFYGLSMMTGRVRPGDVVECDGIRGTVRSIGIIATQIQTIDNQIVAFPNRQLFEKNFKNLTLNQQMEIQHIMFDIADANDIPKARQLMLEAIQGIDGVLPELFDPVVVVNNFGSGIIRLDFKVPIDSAKFTVVVPAVREAVYNAFDKNGIRVATFLQHLDLGASEGIMTRGLPLT